MGHGPYERNWEDFHSFRPGHDMHYGLDGTKMEKLGWVAPVDFRESLTDTVKWSMDHKKWLGL
jgi:dTDP-glucose 4,6-dehydratase